MSQMKKRIVLFALSIICLVPSLRAQDIFFGTELNAKDVVKEARHLAKTTQIQVIKEMENGCDKLCSYRFEEAGEDFPFRVVVPAGWDGKKPLPLLMFLHGAWNTESSYLDDNDKQLVKLAMENGFLLVSPLGGHSSYGNLLVLPAEFGKNQEAREIVAKNREDKEQMAAQAISEKDLINVLELVLANYPVDRKHMFLSGHSMGAGGTWYIGAKYPKYWNAYAPLSGPFVLDFDYPWKTVLKKPLYYTEGLQAPASLESSRELKKWLETRHRHFSYAEFDGDHPGMVPMALPSVFKFLKEQCR